MNRDTKNLLISTIMIVTISASSPFLNAGWIRDFGGTESDYGHWVEPTYDGGYIVTGTYVTALEDSRISKLYLIKTDSTGDTVWTRTYENKENQGGINSGRCVQISSDGGYVIVGTVGAGSHAWLLKTNPDGDTVWTRVYEDADWCYCVRELSSGYVFSGDGWAGRSDNLTKDLLLRKVDKDGNVLWSRTYGSEEWIETGFSLQVTPDGGYIVTGSGPSCGLWILKTDSSGDTLWSREYCLGKEKFGDRGYDIEPTADGGWIITGGVDYDISRQGALCLLRIDSLGDTVWTRIYDYGKAVEVGNSVKEISDGGFIVLGQKEYSNEGRGAIWLLRTDSTGDTLWTRTLGGVLQDRGDCIQLTGDGGYVMTGFTASYSSNDSKQVLLARLDSLGYSSISEQMIFRVSDTAGFVLATLETPAGLSGRLSLYDSKGQWVESKVISGSGEVIFGENLNSGVYFVRLDVRDVSVQGLFRRGTIMR